MTDEKPLAETTIICILRPLFFRSADFGTGRGAGRRKVSSDRQVSDQSGVPAARQD